MHHEERDGGRRAVLKNIVAGGAAAGAAKLGRDWTKPVVESVTLPVHAQTTAGPGGQPAAPGAPGGPADLNCMITPVSASAMLGPTSVADPVVHSVTATVLQNGSPITGGGIVVQFQIISGPNAGKGDQVFTEAAGTATFDYLGDGGVGVDVIQASGSTMVNGQPLNFLCTATMSWLLPASVSCTLEPMNSSPEVNGGAALTVTVLADGLPITGGGITVNLSATGVSSFNDSDFTNAGGSVTFNYNSATPGLDNVTASGAVQYVGGDSLPFSCNGTVDWLPE